MTARPTILVTRPTGQAAELAALLSRAGIASVAVPTVAIDMDSSAPDLDRMLAGLDGAAWLVLTSANGADALRARLESTGATIPASTRVAAVGPATAASLEAAGVRVDHVPDAYLTVEIAAGLGDVDGRRVVLARADAATPDLRDALLSRGARVEEVVAYRTVEGPEESRDRLDNALDTALAGLAFTSGSTVRGLMRLAGPAGRVRAAELPAFCIGPVTARVADEAGLRVAAIASEHTAAGLAAAISAHLDRGMA